MTVSSGATGLPSHAAGPPPGGTGPTAALVADVLVPDDGPPVPCPAADLLDGSLTRAGVPVRRGPVSLPGPGGTGAGAVLAAVLDGTGAEGADARIGLGVEIEDLREGAAARTEEAARAAFSSWREAAGVPRRVLLAAPRSFCAGVERAIEIVERALEQCGAPVYVRKQIVHNTRVVADLQERGAVFVDELDAVPAGRTVVFSAHGVSPAVREEADRRGLDVIDATCPLVTKVHTEARRFASRGDTVVLIGHGGHEEVEGTLGEAPSRTVLVQTPEEAARLEVPDPGRISYLTQTTLAVDETAEIVDVLRARFPALRGPASDDICYATTNRQDALAAIADESDTVLVVGSDNSSNSVRLVELAERNGTPAHLIDAPGDIRPEWLAGARTVGLTAGASAPPALVDAVVAALRGLGPLSVTEYETARETVHFTLPAPVRRR
ncbi:4-hydroxy-3-methylbut-2-enyl diphosphate reductase [Nocardiopsis suaedae]|uniref:4-hydroxy-3-methylbut-2-enyl diphosphate reductase n=1 Tax=Nocardiopsis suaedae TaxID=3018444 RepID=A0ABT4TRG6_9ACTN|nr:4-hydroxy-3-methylbut-2-enyl diphosphate reductase [Nocardiopsis suaedae]MDA2806960.1 4-hydroxy-3-methylbut-2-enyl diphosphate reductase [Nocardiopsis suaedae]